MRPICLCVLMVVCGLFASVPAVATAETRDFDKLLSEVSERYEAVVALRERVSAAGIDTKYEQTALHTVSLFLEFAQQDRENAELWRRMMARFSRMLDTTVDEAVEALPFRQLTDCLAVLDRAERSLTELERSGGGRPLVPATNFGDAVIDGPHFKVDGKVVFPSTLTWMPHNEANAAAYGSMRGSYTVLARTRPEMYEQAEWTRSVIDVSRKPGDETRFQSGLFLGHSPARWMVEQHPEIKLGARFFTKYDIDNPRVRGWIDRLLDVAIEQSSPTNPMNFYLLANEPHFGSTVGSWKAGPASEATMQKFRAWTQARYTDLDALNAAWGESYESFDDVTIPMPVPTELRGSAKYYDWCRFNMDRVNEWFAFLKDTIRRYDPEASVTIKMLGAHMKGASRDHGLDIESLIRMQEVPGLDAHTVPEKFNAESLERRKRHAHDGAINWRSQAMFLDMIESIAPDRPVYDSEWHGFGGTSWVSSEMSHDYVRAAIWLSFLHGNSAINAWYWGRYADGRPRASGLSGPMTQPIALNAFGSTMHELNAHAEQVAALATTPIRVFIFYTEESAIQSAGYTAALIRVHEAATLTGARVGFATPRMLREDPDTHRLILLPHAEYISDESLQALAHANAKLVRIGSVGYTRNEHGQPRPNTDPQGRIVSATVVPEAPAAELASFLDRVFTGSGVHAPLRIVDAKTGGLPGGVLSRVTPTDNGWLMSLVNTSLEPRQVRLIMDEKTPVAHELLWVNAPSGKFDGTLPSLGVRLLEVRR